MQKVEEMSHKEGNELEARVKNYQEKKNKLGRVINTKAQSMFEHEEKQVGICHFEKLQKMFSSHHFF